MSRLNYDISNMRELDVINVDIRIIFICIIWLLFKSCFKLCCYYILLDYLLVIEKVLVVYKILCIIYSWN